MHAEIEKRELTLHPPPPPPPPHLLQKSMNTKKLLKSIHAMEQYVIHNCFYHQCWYACSLT